MLNFSKNLYYKSENETPEGRVTYNLSSHKDNLELEQCFKGTEQECESPYSRNSQILMKLCREESVKRLISGWNKAVEHPDDVKNISKDIHLENDSHTKSPSSKKVSDQVLNEPRISTSLHEKCDAPVTHKVENSVANSKRQSDSSGNHHSRDTSSKNNSPDDVHAGKLVGKATVIRRPSIAKLKALFEKTSPQSNSDSSDTGRRRTLFRSHSHYVSHTSRAFSLSDSTNQHNSSKSDSRTPPALKTEENRFDKEKISSQTNTESSHLSNIESSSSLNPTYISQQLTAQGNVNYIHSSDNNRKAVLKVSYMSPADYSKESIKQVISIEHPVTHSSVHEPHFHSDDFNVNPQMTIKHTACEPKTDKPPELPLKKKPVLPAPQTVNFVEKNKETEVTVPRFRVNMPKESTFSESSNKSGVTSSQRDTINRNSGQMEKSYKEFNPPKVSSASPDWTSDDSLREYVRHSHTVERHVLHKNQSFSDPEQSARCLDQNGKQVAKPKLSLTDQTFPKLTYSADKGLDEKVSFSHECAYMNINSLAQKNIRQIEEKLKNHPRGAIIDLTSRKSYIDETTPERQYVFRNTSEPVKFLPRQEAKELYSSDKFSSKTGEQSNKETSAKIKANAQSSKSTTPKAECSKKDLDHINSKNLLLHSPPPKSKRGHLSKSNSKSPSTTSNSQGSNDKLPETTRTPSSTSDQTAKVTSPPKYPSANVSQNINVGPKSPSPAADRSDPRYFPVNRQTASDARYESEKQKAEAREAACGRQPTTYEPIYSHKPVSSVYHKIPPAYEKSLQDTKALNDIKYSHDNCKSHYDKEPLYGLQRSTSGPQILASSDSNQKVSHSPDVNGPYSIYGQVEDSKLSKSFHGSESRAVSHYESNPYATYGTIGQHNAFPPGPPKPPRTFHYDMKNQEKTPETYSKSENAKREGGRYIVSVASPKHSNVQNQTSGSVPDYRYDRVSDMEHAGSSNVYQPQATYVNNEVHMSKSYPFSNYDRSYYPRPYGKQYYPETIAFRNVQPVHHVSNNIYAVPPEKPVYPTQNIYGTVKHRNTFTDYENVYDAQRDYIHAMSSSNAKSEHQNIYQSINPNSMPGVQYPPSDASVYAVMQAPKIHTQYVKTTHVPSSRDFKNVSESAGNSVPKRTYFDTLQRRNKQHVTWEQRRSHDDMDIRPPPSARLREQIHARRSMVELDNLEISVVSDEGL